MGQAADIRTLLGSGMGSVVASSSAATSRTSLMWKVDQEQSLRFILCIKVQVDVGIFGVLKRFGIARTRRDLRIAKLARSIAQPGHGMVARIVRTRHYQPTSYLW